VWKLLSIVKEIIFCDDKMYGHDCDSESNNDVRLCEDKAPLCMN
jgi:hypothetical protein